MRRRGEPNAEAAAFGDRNHHGIFMDIQSHVFICRLHVLVSVSGCFGCCSHFTHSLAALPFTG